MRLIYIMMIYEHFPPNMNDTPEESVAKFGVNMLLDIKIKIVSE